MNDRNRLIELIREGLQSDGCIASCNHPYCNEVKFIADHLIANGVTIQKHERWEKRRMFSTDVICSECSTLQTTKDSQYKSRFCPNCGARMDADA